MEDPSYRLRQIRLKLGLTTRDVDQMSRRIAEEEGNEDFVISHGRLVQIESGGSCPSIYKLFTIAAIYGLSIQEVLGFYVDVSRVAHHHLSASHPSTHLVDIAAADQPLKFPIRFDPSFSLAKSTILARAVEVWGDIPVGLLQQFDLRKRRWGLIGLTDYTMYPLLRPGSLVQLDESTKPAPNACYATEWDRPIYFVETRDGYICSWCELHKNRLVCIPHPLSPVGIREFAYPNEAEIVGRVTAVAARLVNSRADAAHTAKSVTEEAGSHGEPVALEVADR